MTNMKNYIAAALTADILAIGLVVPAMTAEVPAESIRVSSYKDHAVDVRECNSPMIGPAVRYTVTSSGPNTVAVEQVLTSWVTVAKAEGSVEITVSNSVSLTDNMDIRLINQARRANGAELPANEALMSVAQTCSD